MLRNVLTVMANIKLAMEDSLDVIDTRKEGAILKAAEKHRNAENTRARYKQ